MIAAWVIEKKDNQCILAFQMKEFWHVMCIINVWNSILSDKVNFSALLALQEAQLILTNPHLEVSQGNQTWYHSIC